MKRETEITEKEFKEYPEPALKAIFTAREALERAPEIVGVPTGIEGLDELFFILLHQKAVNLLNNLLAEYLPTQYLILLEFLIQENP